MIPMLAAINGEDLIMAVLWIVIAAMIYWVVTWGLAKIGVPEPFNKIINVVLVIAVVVFLVNALLSLAGHPLIVWHGH